jgi:hypothetical protein
MADNVIPLFDAVRMQLAECDRILDELRADVRQQELAENVVPFPYANASAREAAVCRQVAAEIASWEPLGPKK